jgi:FRG domain
MSDAFWKSWEVEIASFDDALKLIHGVFEKWSISGRTFAWRGQVDASWGLNSTLYRRVLSQAEGHPPGELELQEEEGEILKQVHRWSLHIGAHGRLSVMSQLAMLQHYGSPTRLIDVTFNPLIGLWFAVEEQWESGAPKSEERDGRLFAIDVTNRLINEDSARRPWEDKYSRPWVKGPSTVEAKDWSTQTFVWRPPRVDHRIAAQNSGFLLGGVPVAGTAGHRMQWPKGPGKKSGQWSIHEVRQAMSVSLPIHKADATGAGARPKNPVYTMRIKSSAKAEIRKHLEELYGYRHATIYPDYSGFAGFIRSRPVWSFDV